MTVEVLPQKFSVCKVEVVAPALFAEPFCFVGRTERELSLVCETDRTPGNALAREDGWRAFRIAGQLAFSLVGILAELSGILAAAQVGIFAMSTYDTDYILVRENQLPTALEALRAGGIFVQMI